MYEPEGSWSRSPHERIWSQHKFFILPWKSDFAYDFAISTRISQFFLELSLKFISEVSLAASHPLPPQSELLSNYYLYRFIWRLIIYGFITCLIKRFICTCINYSLSSKQIRNSLRAGSGPFPPLYSTHGTVQKLQKYLFIYLFSQQRFVELSWCSAPSTETACLVLSGPAFLLSKTPRVPKEPLLEQFLIELPNYLKGTINNIYFPKRPIQKLPICLYLPRKCLTRQM